MHADTETINVVDFNALGFKNSIKFYYYYPYSQQMINGRARNPN